MLGNHDDREAFARVFQETPLVGGFVQYAIEDHPVRILVLDTLEAVKLLWEVGSDVNAVADFGDISILEGDPYYLIMNNPINLDTLPVSSTVNGKTTPMWGDMRWAGSSVLHGAAVRGQTDIIQFLVDKGARLDARNKLGWTPLTVAAGMFFAQTFKESIDAAILIRKLMIERGLDPSQSPLCPICGRESNAVAVRQEQDQK
jgi:ankyrin repeat protein